MARGNRKLRAPGGRDEAPNLDSITLEVLRHALSSVVEEMATIIPRTAYSLNVREREDYSAALTDAEGYLIAQAQRIPMHMGGMSSAVRALLQHGSPPVRPGDIFITNDPYAGGQHTPDIQLIMPAFHRKRLIGFVTTIAHHLDVGGSSSSAMDPKAREVFQEGLVFPGIRLYAAGKAVDELFRLISRNVRHPDLTLGDLRSQVAAVRTGEVRLLEIVERYGATRITRAFKQFLDISERRMRQCFARIPNGTYRFEDYIDDDGVSGEACKICVAITIKGSNVTVDFSGTSPQRPGAVNSGPTATASPVYFALRTIADKDILLTDGCFRPIRIVAPLGCMLNPKPPQACGARITIAHRIVDVIFGAMAQAVPARVETASYGSSPCYQFVGQNEDGERFILFDCNHGSSGARLNFDGNDGCTDKISNSKNLPIEVTEAQLPFRFEAYEFVQDSGGAGKSRGGLALRRAIRVLKDCNVQIIADRERFAPYGLAGGQPGRTGECLINPGIANGRRLSLKGSTQLRAGDIFSFTTPGSGGFGPPRARARDRILEDLTDEKISSKAAREIYGLEPEAGSAGTAAQA